MWKHTLVNRPNGGLQRVGQRHGQEEEVGFGVGLPPPAPPCLDSLDWWWRLGGGGGVQKGAIPSLAPCQVIFHAPIPGVILRGPHIAAAAILSYSNKEKSKVSVVVVGGGGGGGQRVEKVLNRCRF